MQPDIRVKRSADYGMRVTLIDCVPSPTSAIPFWNSLSGSL
jgi:hypothetical protein